MDHDVKTSEAAIEHAPDCASHGARMMAKPKCTCGVSLETVEHGFVAAWQFRFKTDSKLDIDGRPFWRMSRNRVGVTGDVEAERPLYARRPSDAAEIERMTTQAETWRAMSKTALELRDGAVVRAETAEAALAEERAKVERLELLASEVVSQAIDYYTDRNGKRVTVEGADGEKCSIVPDDALFQLRTALSRERAENA